ncbi:glycosyltransferase family 2 protein [Paenibacillus caui]|uniref:glycosyltransferase family 2 protein n=1 Tax=Paenibacillus caui TaxID=2873927 RepID=UPI001F23B71C|nr:glycosyltransferase family 2 protein [Paenibacillus caui]
MKTIALTMIVKNEEKVLPRCLDSVCKLVDEIIIVDTGSTDRTKWVAQAYGAKIYDWTWNHNFADARNIALDHASCDWNLVLDADEYINNGGAAIRQFINQENAIGRLKLVSQFSSDDGELSFAQSFISRIFPSGVRYEGRIHEQLVSDLPRIKLPVEILHDGYMKSKADRNIPILQIEIANNPKDSYSHYQIAKEFRGINNHVQACHHLEQAYALLTKMESYAPNVIVNLIYELIATNQLEAGLPIIQREQAFLQDFADFHFVCGVFYMKLILSNTKKYIDLFPLIEASYLKCLEIGETDQYESVLGTGSFTALHNLGSLYEVMGNLERATSCYKKAASYGYKPSEKRLQHI